MKQTFKNYFKLGILLLGISLTLVNCQKDDELSSHEKENLSQQPITAVRIYKDKIQSNDRIVAKINEIISIKKQRKTLSKTVLDEVSGIEIETDYAILYTDTTRDYGYHSYTFPVTNTPLEAGLENILISLQPDGSYKEYLIHYDVSEWEIEMIYNKDFVDLEGKTNYIQLENGTFSQDAFEKIYFEDDCWYESTEIAGEPCIVDGHLYGDSRCELIGYYGEATEGFTHTALITCNNSGGGGSTGEGPTGGSNTTGGTNNTPTDDSIVVVSCNSRDILCIEDIEEECSSDFAIAAITTRLTNLTPEQLSFIENPDNCEQTLAIQGYLSANQNDTSADAFAQQAIEALMDEDDLIDEVIFVLENDCNVIGGETNWSDNLDDNEEPKWGQLATKNEILAEINNVSGLAAMNYNEQITALANHFEKNLMYTRVGGDLTIVDSSTDVNRYVYSEVGGWIDFHHVFKIFEWATQNGPFTAITMGEMGEMWQSLKDNNSAYSYEDLPSNYLGVGMYVRFSQDLALGNITWQEAVQTSLDEINCIDPENAPNYDYIPHIVNDHYPQNFTYSPLLGDELKNYHREKFCGRPFNEQINIKEAHENFPR